MARRKNQQLEVLEQEIKNLKSENRALKRQLKALQKYPKQQKQKEKIEPKSDCDNCGKGNMISMDFEFDTFTLFVFTCDVCGHKISNKVSNKKK